jgi:hypothetical protein
MAIDTGRDTRWQLNRGDSKNTRLLRPATLLQGGQRVC